MNTAHRRRRTDILVRDVATPWCNGSYEWPEHWLSQACCPLCQKFCNLRRDGRVPRHLPGVG